jgi:iron complex outermembrane recepter protein
MTVRCEPLPGKSRLRSTNNASLRAPRPGSAACNVTRWPGVALCLGAACTALAEPPEAASPERLEDVVVTATRKPERSFDLPVSIDRVEGRALRDGQLTVNLSESLGAVPGLSVQNRQNYAQDLQMSVRGFGARSSFGVRGVRLYADGIPGTMPDGQGQFSHFDLGSADRIEVLRGPFSALYGNSSGGVISIFTENGQPGFGLVGTAAAGGLGTQRYQLRAAGGSGATDYLVSAAHFEIDGYRDHSRAERNTTNLKVGIALGARSVLTLVANAIETPDVQDPLGLTRNQLETDPTQAGTGALLYNTRKSLRQQQAGATLTTTLSETDELAATVYAGQRSTTQFQAILRAVEEANPLHPGGVIDLDREFRGTDLHVTDRRAPGGTPLTLTAGVAYDVLEEARRGFLNFSGTELGVIGAPRRDDLNHVGAVDEYLQAEWDPAARWRAIAGLRHSDIDVTSRDRAGTQPRSEIRYSATNPVAGVLFRVTADVNAYASYGRGFETPTLNDLAYRSTDGSLPGLNSGLQPAHSDNYELGLKADAARARADLAVFYIRTRNELAVQQNSGGRQVFENIDKTERRGAELALSTGWESGLEARLAYTYLRAVTAAPYQSCAGVPCRPVTVPAGSRLPAVPANALYAGITWRAVPLGFSATAETVGRSQIYVDDRNTDAAAGYWTTNLRAGFAQQGHDWTLSETLRIDNVGNRQYVGSVIVNESNRRFFEPEPGRIAYLLVSAAYR